MGHLQTPAASCAARSCRLAWLGDSVMQLVITEMLYEAKPGASAGVGGYDRQTAACCTGTHGDTCLQQQPTVAVAELAWQWRAHGQVVWGVIAVCVGEPARMLWSSNPRLCSTLPAKVAALSALPALPAPFFSHPAARQVSSSCHGHWPGPDPCAALRCPCAGPNPAALRCPCRS
jgi:hypothetical protein